MRDRDHFHDDTRQNLHTVQQTQEWQKEGQVNARLANETEAVSILRAVIPPLRDRLSVEEIDQFSTQLASLIRGIVYQGWLPSYALGQVGEFTRSVC